jgi:hypothetical protein
MSATKPIADAPAATAILASSMEETQQTLSRVRIETSLARRIFLGTALTDLAF